VSTNDIHITAAELIANVQQIPMHGDDRNRLVRMIQQWRDIELLKRKNG